MSLSKYYSSVKLPDEPEEALLQSNSSHKDIDYDYSLPATAGFATCSQATGKLSFLFKKIVPTKNQSSASSLGIISKSQMSLSYGHRGHTGYSGHRRHTGHSGHTGHR